MPDFFDKPAKIKLKKFGSSIKIPDDPKLLKRVLRAIEADEKWWRRWIQRLEKSI